MPVHMTYKPTRQTRPAGKKGAARHASSVSGLPPSFPCKMIQIVEASDPEAALAIANPPAGSIPTLYQLNRRILAIDEYPDDLKSGVQPQKLLSGNLFVLIYS